VLVGSIAVLFSSCRGDTISPVPPARLEEIATAPIVGTVATQLASSPTFTVVDASGQPLAGVRVSIAVTDGGGTLRNAPSRTSHEAATPVGTWTLGTHAGRNALTVTVANLPPLVIEATGLPGPAMQLIVARGDQQTGFAGDMLAQAIAVAAVDQFGNGVPGIAIDFAVVRGGGTLSQTTGTTDAIGIAGVSWQLGRQGGPQETDATASVGSGQLLARVQAQIRSDYDIELRFVGAPPSPAVAAIFAAAVDRLHGLIVGDIADVPVQGFDAGRCGVPGVTLNELVDDVLIYASVEWIDGPGKILGFAGPCIARTQTQLGVVGVMRLDRDDLGGLVSTGRLEPVIVHEMLHILGFGTIWRSLGLVVASGTPDPRFAGSLATLRCDQVGGQLLCGQSVPLENTGSPGTLEAHWREATFDGELMTGFIEPPGVPDPLSVITAGSLEDIGYVVNYLAADPYSLLPSATARPRPPQIQDLTPWELFELPRFDVTPSGWIRKRSPPGSARP
jgi:hypothetical protein